MAELARLANLYYPPQAQMDSDDDETSEEEEEESSSLSSKDSSSSSSSSSEDEQANAAAAVAVAVAVPIAPPTSFALDAFSPAFTKSETRRLVERVLAGSADSDNTDDEDEDNDAAARLTLQSIHVGFTAAAYALTRAYCRANSDTMDCQVLLPPVNSVLDKALWQTPPKSKLLQVNPSLGHSDSGGDTESDQHRHDGHNDNDDSDSDSDAPIAALASKGKKKRGSSSPPTKKKLPNLVSIEKQQTEETVDPRIVMTRAILCATASITLGAITPPASQTSGLDGIKSDVDPLDIPQNEAPPAPPQGDATQPKPLNMGSVMIQSTSLGKRIVSHVAAASARKAKRHKFVVDSLQCQYGDFRPLGLLSKPQILPLALTNPFAWTGSPDHDPLTRRSRHVSAPDSPGSTSSTSTSSRPVLVPSLLETNNSFTDLAIQRLSSDRVKDYHEDDLWTSVCKPRFLKILDAHPTPSSLFGRPDSHVRTRGGNVLYHDVEWTHRANRIADILRTLALPCSSHNVSGTLPNFGPHLIVCAADQIGSWEMAFAGLGHGILSSDVDDDDDDDDEEKKQDSPDHVTLRALSYNGTKRERKKLLPYLYATALGGTAVAGVATSSHLCHAPYHVVITSYTVFIQDYTHLCQIPWQVVLLDDGMSWLGTAYHDPNGKIGRAWDCIWSKSDNEAGLAGLPPYLGGRGDLWNSWVTKGAAFIDYEGDDDDNDEDEEESSDSDDSSDEDRSETSKHKRKKANPPPSVIGSPNLIGVTARFRILTCSSMTASFKGTLYPAPVPALVQFICPQYAEVTREEWDRSRITVCYKSMRHFRSLLARALVVYPNDDPEARILARNQVNFAFDILEGESPFSETYDGSEEKNDILEGSLVSTDRLVAKGKIIQSRRFATAWLTLSMRQEIGSVSLDSILDAVARASQAGHICEEVVSTGSAGAGGRGGNVYGCAIRCGRAFTNEQGLRQHIAAMHAPPGTWLCRSCGGDCGTSMARTHHERYCAAAVGVGGTSGATPTVGQIGGVGKQGAVGTTEDTVDKDGAQLVPTYRGVWVNTLGKYFAKLSGSAIKDNDDRIIEFVSADDAALFYDSKAAQTEGAELNFKKDATRIVYPDTSSMANASRGLDALGGGASSVVPALSIINLKDLPKNVKPLLRDPRQTSRAGANSKRHVYKYRGVCRQARKGHDRWQSQISFNGTNHYLGTYNSEWDAAAIYAWAHLILYGEEATKKAEKEGEEAVAAWEQELKDIAEGKIVEKPKPEKKKGKPGPKKGVPPKSGGGKVAGGKAGAAEAGSAAKTAKSKTITKAKATDRKTGYAILIGIHGPSFAWSVDTFAKSLGNFLSTDAALISLLTQRLARKAEALSFKAILKGLSVTLGSGNAAENQDCFMNCDEGSGLATCSASAAKIEHAPSDYGSFQLLCCSDDDIVTVNARRITATMGPFPIKSGDVCSVGARVFLFSIP